MRPALPPTLPQIPAPARFPAHPPRLARRRNTADADVVRFLRLFTELPEERIAELARLQGQAVNEAKQLLADEATAMLHGQGCLPAIQQTAAELFAGGGGAGGDMGTLPTVEVSASELAGGLPLVDLFVRLSFAKSKSEVRRLIAAGGARVNDEKVTDEALVLGSDAFVDGQLKLSSGKKKHGLVKLL